MHSSDHSEQAGREAVLKLLSTVIDPELGIDIVELGLVYGVSVSDDTAEVVMTMTTPACPMANHLVDEVNRALQGRLGPYTTVDVRLVWEPRWKPDMMSDKAKAILGWK